MGVIDFIFNFINKVEEGFTVLYSKYKAWKWITVWSRHAVSPIIYHTVETGVRASETRAIVVHACL